MRIFFSVIFLCLLLVSLSASALSTSEYVTALEKRLFGVTYDNQSIDSRVDRIEMQIYENKYKGSPEERLLKIDKIYPKEEFETGKISYPETTGNNLSDNQYYEQEEKADYNNYPIVNEIEMSIYKRNYSGEDIYKRLERIEKELYGNVKNDMTLQERVENLKALIPKKNSKKYLAKDYENMDYSSITDNSKTNNFYTDTLSSVSRLEQDAFNRTFAGESTSKRLDRLERFYFGGSLDDQSDEERATRLNTIMMSGQGMPQGYLPSSKSSQWAGIIMSLLMIGLGFLL